MNNVGIRRVVVVSIWAIATALASLASDNGRVRITWQDVAPVHARLQADGITSATFTSYVERVRVANARRVREGDLDHLVFYLLQSTRFTSLPPIEPALSAKALVDSLDPRDREAFFRNPATALARVPAPVTARAAALLRALESSHRDQRLAYFRALANAAFPLRLRSRQGDGRRREQALLGEYLRAMKFLYEKEFIAQRSARGADAVAELYRTRGLSTDTAVEAGFLVYQGLGVIRSLEPERRIRRVLVVGPGLDLAPRTGFSEARPPESYQPWAVIDALLGLGLSRVEELEIIAADINPRVVAHLQRAPASPPALTLASEIRESEQVVLTPEYREYVSRLGRAIGDVSAGSPSIVQVRADVARMLRAVTLDVVTERLTAPRFDLVVATNILPYFDDVALMFAMTNIAGMLAPEGMFLHNEARPLMQDVTTAVGLPLEQSRRAIIASVQGAAAPLVDSVWLHRKPK
jgi:hypothetical protein